DAAGLAQITLTFESKTDPDIAQVQVQNKLQSAIALLPQEVQQQGLTVAKAQRNFMMVIGLYGDNGKYTDIDLADYLASHIQDPISRVEGVGDV
ncbi:efflux RND transporter permease subunit, partial [Escherichia coli]|uniref:efflux RND transporter permease subunit n=5 Tax=Pseudomonadota TaxID=1224 RepID=UPI0028DF2E85